LSHILRSPSPCILAMVGEAIDESLRPPTALDLETGPIRTYISPMDLTLETTHWQDRAGRTSIFKRVSGYGILPSTCSLPVFNRRAPDLTALGQPITIAGKEAVPGRMGVVARRSGGAHNVLSRAVPP
jgi:hypothetical protein